MSIALLSIPVYQESPSSKQVAAIYQKTVGYPAKVLIKGRQGAFHLFIPFDPSLTVDQCRPFANNLMENLRASGIQGAYWIHGKVHEYLATAGLKEYEIQEARINPLKAKTPPSNNDRFIPDDQFKAARRFVQEVARELDRPPTLEEVKAAWREDPEMMSMGTPERFKAALFRIIPYVAKGFKPNPYKQSA